MRHCGVADPFDPFGRLSPLSDKNAPNGRTEVKMEIRLTASVIMATDAVLRLHRRALLVQDASDMRPEGCCFNKQAPTWTNFMFFSRITARKIEKVERVEPTREMPGSWILSRQVDFYHLGKKVATVYLAGNHVDGKRTDDKVEYDNQSFWAVKKIVYLGYQDNPKSLTEVQINGWGEMCIPVQY